MSKQPFDQADDDQTVLLDLSELTDRLANPPASTNQAANGTRDQGAADPASTGNTAVKENSQPAEPSLARSSKLMMVASAASRFTGFIRNIAIAAAISFGFVSDAYNTANTLPNIVYELLLGGVLTSVVVPLLVHAQHEDDDGGVAYTQRLLTLSTVVLAAATVIAVLAAPLLTALYVGSDSPKSHLTTLWAWLLLPEIFFYGIGALFGAILNAKGIFGPPAWAPVLNNLVVIATAGLFIALPGPKTLNPDTITTQQVLLLGIGTTLGIVVQAAALWPALRRAGFRWRWRFEFRGSRLGEAGGLALWVLGYVAVSQVGYVVATRLANEVDIAGRSYAVFSNASLLFQMPYGILGVSLLTALMPRMSRAAARGDTPKMLADFSLGSRLSTVVLLPITAIFTVLGPALGTVIFSLGHASQSGGRQVGIVLAFSAFGLVPFAIIMLQLRVFYAAKDACTPTLINIGIVAVRIVLSLLVPLVLPDRDVVVGLAVVNSMAFVVGMIIGEMVLQRRFGAAAAGLSRTLVRMGAISIVGAGVAWLVLIVVSAAMGTGVLGSAVALISGSLLAGAVIAGGMFLVGITEITEILGRRRRPRISSGRDTHHVN